MQTRKNRKNDESSYEKMLKLRRDLTRAVTLLEFVKRREKTKLEYLHLTIEVYEKRHVDNDKFISIITSHFYFAIDSIVFFFRNFCYLIYDKLF